MRSNCVEMEPLNNESVRLQATLRQQHQKPVQCYATTDANDVITTASPTRDSSSDDGVPIAGSDANGWNYATDSDQ